MGYREVYDSTLDAGTRVETGARLKARARFQGSAQAVLECCHRLDAATRLRLEQRGQELGLSRSDVAALINELLAQPQLREKFSHEPGTIQSDET